jgi:hypothetical protein
MPPQAGMTLRIERTERDRVVYTVIVDPGILIMPTKEPAERDR